MRRLGAMPLPTIMHAMPDIPPFPARLLLAFAIALPGAALAQVSLRDDLGRSVFVKSPPKRIVTLAPFLTELVYAAGAGDRLVGVGPHSDYPPEAKKLPEVASASDLMLEKLADLKPDLVLAWRDGFRRDDIERVSGFGATVFVAQARHLEDVPRLLRAIGVLTTRDVSGAISDYETRLDRLRKANASKPRLAAFLEIWNRPLTTISSQHFMSEALEICGAENVFKDRFGVAPTVSWEDVYEKNPQVIVGAGSAASEREFRDNWLVRPALEAVKLDRMVYVEADTIQRPTTRTPEGIAELCAGLDKVRVAAGLTSPAAAAPAAASPAASAPKPAAAASSPQRPSRGSQYGM